MTFGTVALGALTPFALATQSQGQRIPIEYVRTSANDPALRRSAHPGSEWPARVELIPDAVLVSPDGKESVEYHAEVSVTRGNRVGVAWEADVIDDRGTVIRADLPRGQSRVAQDSVLFTDAIHADLADGFYALRVHVAIAPDNEGTFAFDRLQYVQVVEGKWVEMTQVEWHEQSRAGLAFADDEQTDTTTEVKP